MYHVEERFYSKYYLYLFNKLAVYKYSIKKDEKFPFPMYDI